MSQPPVLTNHLLHETSLYLKQHVHNPVDWRPWGAEAIARAKELDRPIFLSIGYSACHWCHVMEHESFENPEIAQILNDNFVSIKVDREERPDLDQIYMQFVQMSTGAGGWPMSVFLTPDLNPFYGGTYFPPEDHYGRPGFKRLLLALVENWNQRRADLHTSANQVAEQLRDSFKIESSSAVPDPAVLQRATLVLQHAFDSAHGGFGSAPKFPHSMELRLLLRTWKRFGDENALHMTRFTLDKMAMGGIYDHLGGGFHRYSTDARWLAPHFEKMLYDNALLTEVYLEAYQATHEPLYREVVEETVAYVLREMTSPEGPFYSTQDADSEGDEGKFFVWSEAEIVGILGTERAEAFNYVYDVSEDGNWEGHNILNRPKSLDQNVRLLHKSEPELRALLNDCKQRLFEVRSRRIWPGRDEKILTAWNGLMIHSLAKAAAALDNPAYAQAAARAADFILERMRQPDGRLFRSYSSGTAPKFNAYLEDYAYMLDALVSLYEATFEPRWLQAAVAIAGVLIAQFWDEQDGGFFYTGKDHETLIARTKDTHDSSIPSGNAKAVTALLRLHKLTGDPEYLAKAETTMRLFSDLMASSPLAAGQMLLALDFHCGPVDEIAIVGDPANDETKCVLQALRGPFRPNQVLALRSPLDQEAQESVPLLEGKNGAGTVATYICRDFVCQAPLVGAAALEAALK